MTRTKLLGLAIATSLLLGFEPAAEAAPIAPLSNAAELNFSAPVVQVLTRAGVAHRSARRTSRRVVRRHTY